MTQYDKQWDEWDALLTRRNSDPMEIMEEFLRAHGYIVEKPDTLNIPIHVTRTGSFSDEGEWKITLHVRANVGDQKLQIDRDIQINHADFGAQFFSGPLAAKLTQVIIEELRPKIEMGCDLELRKAREEVG